MAAPDLGLLEALMSDSLGPNIWQSPAIHRNAKPEPSNPKSWPELLLFLGYGDADLLSGAVKAWVNILKASAADVVMADYAPAIQLAAKVLGIPVIEAGGGFCVPPLAPLQCFPGVEAHPISLVQKAADELVVAFNAALRRSRSAELLKDLGQYASWPRHRVVLSSPELDHYGERSGVTYPGLLGLGNRAAAVYEDKTSAANGGRKVVGYLKANTPGLEMLIAQLAEANIAAQIYVPNMTIPLGRGSIEVVSQPFDLTNELANANVYLSNGGLNGVGQALYNGCWPVVVPTQAEQVAMARNLVRRAQGAAWLPAPLLSVTHLKQLFSDPGAGKAMPTVGKPETALLQLVDELPKKEFKSTKRNLGSAALLYQS